VVSTNNGQKSEDRAAVARATVANPPTARILPVAVDPIPPLAVDEDYSLAVDGSTADHPSTLKNRKRELSLDAGSLYQSYLDRDRHTVDECRTKHRDESKPPANQAPPPPRNPSRGRGGRRGRGRGRSTDRSAFLQSLRLCMRRRPRRGDVP
jgi:hypothetical protein